MSLNIVISCDRSGQYGTCAARLYTGVSTEADAYVVAARAGWNVGGGRDLCPGCSPPRPRRGGPPCGNNPRVHATSADWQAVADFLAYLKRRATDPPHLKESPSP